MKCNILSLLLALICVDAIAQNRIGVELGAGKPTFAYGSYSSVKLPEFNTDIIFTGNVYYLRKLANSKHWYIGGKASFEQYSFDFNITRPDGMGGVYGTSVLHKSSYLLVGPTVDVGIGKHMQYLHAYANVSMGFLLSADQTTRDYHMLNSPVPVYDMNRTTDIYVNGAMCRVGFGLKQHLPLGKMWQFTFNEGYSFMPFGNISKHEYTGGNSLHPGFLSLQAGVMHKFKDAHKHSERD